MTAHSCRLDGFDDAGMKIVTNNAGLVSLNDAWIELAGVEQRFPIDWLEIVDGIPTVHFDLPDEIEFNVFVCGGIEYFPDTGKIRKLYFMRRVATWTSR